MFPREDNRSEISLGFVRHNSNFSPKFLAGLMYSRLNRLRAGITNNGYLKKMYPILKLNFDAANIS